MITYYFNPFVYTDQSTCRIGYYSGGRLVWSVPTSKDNGYLNNLKSESSTDKRENAKIIEILRGNRWSFSILTTLHLMMWV